MDDPNDPLEHAERVIRANKMVAGQIEVARAVASQITGANEPLARREAGICATLFWAHQNR